MSRPYARLTVAASILPCAAQALHAQDRLRTMPGYDRYQSMVSQIPGSFRSGALAVNWRDERSFEYTVDGKFYRFDLSSRRAAQMDPPRDNDRSGGGPRV